MTETAESQSEARVSFKTSPSQWLRIETLARQHQRSLSGEIRRALDAWIERCEKEEGEAA